MIDFGYGVKLGPLSEDNKNFYLKWRNTQEIFKWCRQNSLISPDEHERWFSGLGKDDSTRMFEVVSIEKKEDGLIKRRPVGVCGLTSINHLNQRAEFSLYIATEYQRKGYAISALKTLCHHGFNNLNLNVIWGESFDGNPAIEMFKKVGFTIEGKRRQFYFRDGKFIDAHLLSLTREDFMFLYKKEDMSLAAQHK